MGNVNVKDQLRPQGLSDFQVAKLTYDFQTFFDLNKDGYLSYKVSCFKFFMMLLVANLLYNYNTLSITLAERLFKKDDWNFWWRFSLPISIKHPATKDIYKFIYKIFVILFNLLLICYCFLNFLYSFGTIGRNPSSLMISFFILAIVFKSESIQQSTSVCKKYFYACWKSFYRIILCFARWPLILPHPSLFLFRIRDRGIFSSPCGGL